MGAALDDSVAVPFPRHGQKAPGDYCPSLEQSLFFSQKSKSKALAFMLSAALALSPSVRPESGTPPNQARAQHCHTSGLQKRTALVPARRPHGPPQPAAWLTPGLILQGPP